MIQEYEKEISLKDYANNYNIYELTSEDIIKLMIKPYLIEEISEAFGVSEKEFNNIRKQKGIENINLENTIRNIETILYYLDSKFRYISGNVRKEIVNMLIQTLVTGIPKKQFYLKNLSEVNFDRDTVMNDISVKKIDMDYRLEILSDIILNVEAITKNLIEKEKNYLLNHNNKKLYNQLVQEKKLGKIFNKEDLTYDSLFELSVIENTPDSLIADIYNMSKSQVRYLRTKFGLSNLLNTRIKNYPEAFIYYAEKNNQIPTDVSIYEYEKVMFDWIEKNYNNNASNINYSDEVIINVGDDKVTYHVTFSDEKYSVKTKTSNKKYNGARHNHKKENETKRIHGKIGEQIALEAEKIRLAKIGLSDLVNDVKLVAQIDEETTLDGLGYDLISFNENREPIFIEIKTSYSSKDKPFFISKTEIEIMQGLKEEYNCKNCLIYYLLIDGFDVTIKNIQPFDINNMKLTPILYKVEESNIVH